MRLLDFGYAIAAALALALIGWVFRKWYTSPGIFAGEWTGEYISANSIRINEALLLRSAFGIVWGTSDCRWHESGRDRTGVYRVLGLCRANCLMGIYYPNLVGEHDMGVFITLLEPGTQPTTAAGLTTNFESDDCEDSDTQQGGPRPTSARSRSHPLVARTYVMTREK